MKRKTKKYGDRNRRVVVNDRIQKGYCYELSAPVGRNFDPEFKPELTPQQMLALGVLGEGDRRALAYCLPGRAPRRWLPTERTSVADQIGATSPEQTLTLFYRT